MKLKQTIFTLLGSLFIVSGAMTLVSSPVNAAKCGGVDTAILSCGGREDAKKLEDNGVWHLLLMVLNIMTALVGIAAVGGIVYGSILYASAQDNDSQVKKAKDTIANVVIGIIAFALMYSFLQFIIPGGVFN